MHSTISYFQHLSQLWLFVLIYDYWKEKFPWWGLRQVLIYGYSDTSLKGGLIFCPDSKIIVAVLSQSLWSYVLGPIMASSAFIAYIWKFHTLSCWVNYASIKLCLFLWEGSFHPPKEYLRQYVSSRSTSALQLSHWRYRNSPHSDMRSSVSWAYLVIVMRNALYGFHYFSVSALKSPELSRKTLHRLP